MCGRVRFIRISSPCHTEFTIRNYCPVLVPLLWYARISIFPSPRSYREIFEFWTRGVIQGIPDSRKLETRPETAGKDLDRRIGLCAGVSVLYFWWQFYA